MKYLHTMIRVTDLDASLDFFINKLGFVEQRRHVNEKARYTLVFVAAPESLMRQSNSPTTGIRKIIREGGTLATWRSRLTMSTTIAPSCWPRE